MQSLKSIKKKANKSFILSPNTENQPQEIIYPSKIPRPSSSKGKNIQKFHLKKKHSLSKLLSAPRRNHHIPLNKIPNAYENLISITSYRSKQLPCSASNSPSFSLFDNPRSSNPRTFSPPSQREDYFSPRIPNSIDNQNQNQTKIITHDKSVGQSTKSLKKIVVEQPKIFIRPKILNSKLFQHVYKEEIISKKVYKDLNDLITYNVKVKTKGKIKRGLCLDLPKSPVPKVVHNINVLTSN
ncbi:hypothetical protein SteCoe_19730 [Stentor coeruleus]|uniref:Uncharacterized protein n=1 Tax=Stentor coeruleus TaxID=5963 RepID=A0A1R2BTK3_9CILI|nr:hypothetical protein SteCoe_19730 [Stentor coeruleus]